MNESEIPLDSVVSPYRRIARRAWLCRQECAICDCSAQVAVALTHTSYSPKKLLDLPEIPPEIKQLITTFQQQSGAIISEPGVCEHIDVVRLPQLHLKTDCSDDEL